MKEQLKVTDVFDVDVLQKIQDSFSEATGLAAVTVDNTGNPVTTYSNFTPYCYKIREDKARLEACYNCDSCGGKVAAKSGRTSIYICHGGLVDMGVPIMVNDTYLGAILAGQVRAANLEEMKQLPYGGDGKLTDLSKDNGEIGELYQSTKKIELHRIEAAAELLHTISNYIVEKKMIEMMQEELHRKNMELVEEVKLRSEVESALKEAELKALQSQMNPHFLFNVLNTIGRLALMENAEKTQDMIYSFAEMLRYTLKKEKSNIVTLNEEIEHVRNYLTIQKTRLGKRLEFSIDMDPGSEEILCPFMTIQPFVENAINHAIEPYSKNGHIDIKTVSCEDDVIITITDDGRGMSKEVIENVLEGKAYSSEKNTGIGINNANKRLKYYFGQDNGINIISGINEGTIIKIKIPKKAFFGREAYV